MNRLKVFSVILLVTTLSGSYSHISLANDEKPNYVKLIPLPDSVNIFVLSDKPWLVSRIWLQPDSFIALTVRTGHETFSELQFYYEPGNSSLTFALFCRSLGRLLGYDLVYQQLSSYSATFSPGLPLYIQGPGLVMDCGEHHIRFDMVPLVFWRVTSSDEKKYEQPKTAITKPRPAKRPPLSMWDEGFWIPKPLTLLRAEVHPEKRILFWFQDPDSATTLQIVYSHTEETADRFNELVIKVNVLIYLHRPEDEKPYLTFRSPHYALHCARQRLIIDLPFDMGRVRQ